MNAASNKYNNHGQRAQAFEDGGLPVVGKEEQRGGGGASATDAALALSRLPVLGHFRKKLSFCLAIFVILANLVALIGLVVYFRRLCTNQYGVLPNESGDGTPPALASLESQGGVTIMSRTLVNFMNDTSYAQLGQGYWTPLALTCGGIDTNLESCAATLPIVVEYEQCHPWVEVRRCHQRCTLVEALQQA